jgi:hypothetical protein
MPNKFKYVDYVKGKYYVFESDDHELREIFASRVNFILKQLEKGEDLNYDKLVQLSRIHVNREFYNVDY